MPDRISVTAGDFIRNFGLWQSKAMQYPISVTHHGRERLVMLSSERYSELLAANGVEVKRGTSLDIVVENLAEGFCAFDIELNFISINRMMEVYLGQSRKTLEGGSLLEAFPKLVDSIFVERLRRVLKSREPTRFALESLLFAGQHLEINIFPLPEGVGVLVDNMTELLELREQVSLAEALRQAFKNSTRAALIECDARGRLVHIDESFVKWIGFTSGALINNKLFDVVSPADRRRVMDAFEGVISSRKVAVIDVHFMAKDLNELPLQLAIAPMHSDTQQLQACIVAMRTD